ncbi:MAG: hypothetical protein V1806_03490 [Pseudomonadota bacterium]
MAQPDDANPQRLLGYRNLECPYYLRCLDQAVRRSWPTFSCQHCAHQNLKQPLRAEDLDQETPGWEDIWSQTGWSEWTSSSW